MHKPPKYRIIKPEKHLAWVKTLPCIVCAGRNRGYAIYGGLPLPLCDGCTPSQSNTDLADLAKSLDLMSHDITAAINIIGRFKDA